jgi:hypothetical protein
MPGETMPYSGLHQRISASKPVISSWSRATIGWKTSFSSPLAMRLGQAAFDLAAEADRLVHHFVEQADDAAARHAWRR